MAALAAAVIAAAAAAVAAAVALMRIGHAAGQAELSNALAKELAVRNALRASLADRDALLAEPHMRAAKRSADLLHNLAARAVKLDDCLQYVALTKIDTSAQAFGASRGLWRDDVQMHWALAKARYGPRRMTRLHWAAAKGYVARVVELLEWSSDIEARDVAGETDFSAGKGGGCTPLQWGCITGRVNVVRELLRRGAKVEAKADSGVSPLQNACINGHLEVVRALLDAGALLESRNSFGATPLLSASGWGRVNVVRELLVRGADASARDNAGDAALHYGASEGHGDVLCELLKRASPDDMNARDNLDRSPLMLAVHAGHMGAASILIGSGAEFDPH